MMKHVLWVGLFGLLAATANAASPVLNSVTPRGVQRGTEAVVFFNGARLSDAREVLFYYPGLNAAKLEVVNDNQLKAVLKVSPNCRLGEHALRVRTASGISELRNFYVGALPQVEEKEPNSDFAAPQKVPLNVTISGVIDNEDVDYFAFEAKKGQRVSVEIEGMRLANTFFDPYIAILDSKRFELAASDDAPLLGQDAACSVIIPADGTYAVQVRESAYGGSGACGYRLHLGTFPRPTAVVPAGGRLGDEVEVRLLGDPAGEMRQKIKLPATPEQKFGVFAQDAGGISPSPMPFRLSEFGNVIEVEPNDTPQQATPVAELPAALNGVIDRPGDIDYFRFTAKKGQAFDVHCYARRLGSALDSVMAIAPLSGPPIIFNDDAVGPDSYFRFTAPEDKEYVLSVTDHLRKGGPNYFYRVEFTPVKPQVTLGLAKVDPLSQQRQTIAVPRGNRYAALVAGTRRDFGGELVIGAEGLPAGLTFTAENMAASLDVVPVVFEAAPEAQVGGTLARFNARHADPNQKIQSTFMQTVPLVVGPGNSVFWRHDVDRAAVAVTEEVPFQIRIVEPKAPLVQNGSMNLKVVAERKAGFTAPITIVPLFNPPGVNAAGSATIPQGQNETVLPMNAAPNAQVRKWKTAVLASATVGGGPVWVSSQLATLEVASPFVTFAMERAAGEQGKITELFCKVQHGSPFQGAAKVQLVGLPPKVTAPVLEITNETKELAFQLTIDPTSPPGQRNNVFCQVFVVQNGETVLHNVGGTQLRIDVPLPPRPNEPPKPPPQVVTKPPDPAQPPPKRLTRLEQLRKEQEEREKTAAADPKK